MFIQSRQEVSEVKAGCEELETRETRDSGAADKAAIQRVRVPPCQLPDSGT